MTYKIKYEWNVCFGKSTKSKHKISKTTSDKFGSYLLGTSADKNIPNTTT